MNNIFAGVYPWMLEEELIETKEELYVFARIYGLTIYNGIGFTGSRDALLKYIGIEDVDKAADIINDLVCKGLLALKKQSCNVFRLYYKTEEETNKI